MSHTTTETSTNAPLNGGTAASGGAQPPLAQLRDAVLDSAAELVGPDARSRQIVLERPPSADLGDYSTNAALTLAGLRKRPPRELAEQLGQALSVRLQGALQRYEIAGPGFLNLFLDEGWHRRALDAVLAFEASFGGGGAPVCEAILVEFVSANPTGPMHVGHARNAAYGDSLARLLAFHGHRVEREFYVNDAGSQIVKLGESIRALARGEEVPEDGYRGEYVVRLVDAVPDAAEAEPQQVGFAAVAEVLREVESSLARFNVLDYDHWQRESALHEPDEGLRGEDGASVSPVEHTLQLLRAAGHTFRSDGALWLRTTDFGDDKDRVLIRSSGEHTYFASDIAYHQSKRERGFRRQIDVWGADHHGYLPRMRAAYEALGGDPSELEMLTMQLVHLLSGGERSQMSKRAGTFVTLDDLVEEIGVDAARWYLLSRSHDTTVELDLELATRQSSENPVYYVQYAHARIASMLRRAAASRAAADSGDAVDAGSVAGDALDAGSGAGDALDAGSGAGDALDAGSGAGDALDAGSGLGAGARQMEPLHPSELAVIHALLAFPDEVREAANRRAPHRIASYALALAQEFTAFYRDCRVIGATPRPLEAQRLAICLAVRRVLERSLHLLGVSAPQEM